MVMNMPLWKRVKKFKDPVCGMEVTEDTQWKIEHQNNIYYFCSETCLKEFQTNPEKYTSTMSHSHMSNTSTHKHSGCC
jgi:YHS domain-containing protein